jgi:S1-C subfamily serine protease
MLVAQVAPIAAQVRERTLSSPRARVWVNGQEMDPLDWVANRRARLGVVLDMAAVDNDSIGATLSSVTPGGPAAKAGLRAGDIITRIDGQRLVRVERDRDRDEEQSLAALRLIELVAKIEPGDTVALEYRRGGETRTASVVTSAERTMVVRQFPGGDFNLTIPRMEGELRRLPMTGFFKEDGPEGAFRMAFGGPFADLELAPINPDLGAYFGVTEGVLVIDTPEQNTFGLKGGDVILSVDGRKARGPSSLLRILRSYEAGDVVKLEVMRNKARQTISSKVERPRDE